MSYATDKELDMNPDRTALFVVDVQNGFISSRSRHVIPSIVETVQQWQARGGSTVFTRFINAEDSPFERLIGWTRLRTEPEINIIEPLQPYTDSGRTWVIDKTTYTAFSPEVVNLINREGWTDLIVCGIATESCVSKTAVDAFERNLTPWVLTDACASHAGQEAHDAGLLVTKRYIGRGQMVTRDQALNDVFAPTA